MLVLLWCRASWPGHTYLYVINTFPAQTFRFSLGSTCIGGLSPRWLADCWLLVDSGMQLLSETEITTSSTIHFFLIWFSSTCQMFLTQYECTWEHFLTQATVFENRQSFRDHVRSFRNVPGLSITYQVFGEHIHILGTPLTSSIKIIRKYKTRVIIYSKLSVINFVHMTAFSNTSQDFREHARSFRNVPGLSISYQVFGEHIIHILGTPLTSSIKIIRTYRHRVIIYSKLSVINCVHMAAFSNTSQDFREHARSFRNVGGLPGLSITYQVFGGHPQTRDSAHVKTWIIDDLSQVTYVTSHLCQYQCPKIILWQIVQVLKKIVTNRQI